MTAPAIAHQSQLETTGALGLTLTDGREIFVVRVHGQIHAFENRCPHQYVRLDYDPDRFLELGGELIQCSMHGALFLPESGECVAGPCQGQSLIPVAVSVDEAGHIHLASE